MPDESATLTEREVAKILRLKPGTLAKWRQRKHGPPFTRMGARVIRYSSKGLNEWLEFNTVTPEENTNG